MSARVRSPRKARRLIDEAAVSIARIPDSWYAVVSSVREALGRNRLPDSVKAPNAHAELCSEVAGDQAVYPIKHVMSLEGGGMNTVMRSIELFSGREIVLRKHLPAASAVEEALRTMRDAVVRERLATLPRHPVIPRFWATGTVNGERCEVFDFAPGTTLSSYVARKGLTYGEALRCALHAARGLRHLHERGLIHGDIKPENFCVNECRRPDGSFSLQVTLIDFDIVSTPEEQIHQYSLGNGLEGTLPYMPPENFRQTVPEDPTDARNMVFSKDVFALGLTFARVITGRFPRSFYTSMGSLLEKKIAGEELIFEWGDAVPRAFRDLVGAMCNAEWMFRPGIVDVISSLRRLAQEATSEELATPLVYMRAVEVSHADVATQVAPELPEEAPVAPSDMVGPYVVVNRSFMPRPPGSDQRLPLAELRDPFGRRLIGVPNAFATATEERAFYDERCVLLKDLNEVRIKHPELFPGSFRDLVREEKAGVYLVWILRPLLEGALDLRQYLKTARPEAPVKEKLTILRRAAEALAVLEDADYRLPRLTPELIFFVPQPVENPSILTRGALTRPIKRLFDVPGREGFFRQELMGTSSARRGPAGRKSRTVTDLLDIATEIGVFRDLGAAEGNYLLQIAGTESWRERVSILTWVEMQSA